MRPELARLVLLLALLPAALPASADFVAGQDAADAGDYATAFAEFARSAAQGDMRAANALGELYERGDGVEADPVRAAEWYRRAADAGNREAQYNLAGMYRSGDGVPLDAERSMAWYLLAAEQGLPIAQFFVGKNHEHGQGVPQDMAAAWAWYALAAEAGDGGSASNRDRVAGLLDSTQRRRARLLLREQAEALDLSERRLAALGLSVEAPRAEEEAATAAPELVAAVQTALADLGYDVGSIDGIAGGRTRNAIAEFSRSVGMERTPPLGVALLTRLQATRTAREEASRVLRQPTPEAPAEAASEPAQVLAEEVSEASPDAPPSLAERAASLLRALGYARADTGDGLLPALAAFAADAGLATPPALTDSLVSKLSELAAEVQTAPRERDLVRAIQSALAARGHDPGPVDGLPGSRTRAAVAGWAADAGLAAPPSLSPLLLALLRTGPVSAEAVREPVLQGARDPGSEARSVPLAVPEAAVIALQEQLAALSSAAAPEPAALVRGVQSALSRLGFEPGPVDGLPGSRTRAAVRAFRQQRGLAGEEAIDSLLVEQLRAALASSDTEQAVTAAAGETSQAGDITREPAASVAGGSLPLTDEVELDGPELVRGVQRLLAELGFEPGPADGIAGNRTRNATLAFQRARGLEADGLITQGLLARLRATRAAKPTASPVEVRSALLSRGYRVAAVDGSATEAMREALRRFQRDQDLAQTGEADPPTLARLLEPPDAPVVDAALVRDVQTALAARGLEPGPVDGVAGPRTRAAVAAFRAAERLPAGGVDVALLRRLGLL